MYLLDTNVCVEFLRRAHPGIVGRMENEDPARLLICTVTRGELLFGARRSATPARAVRDLTRFFESLGCLPFDDPSSEHYADIRADLASRGTPIGPNDVIIASIARSNDLTLVTHNTREFGRVVGLRIEDWQV